MLILARNAMQKVLINGGEIVVTVVDIRKDSVRLGFDAAKGITIHREEVQRKIDTEGSRSDSGK